MSLALGSVPQMPAPREAPSARGVPDGSLSLEARPGRWRAVVNHFTTWAPMNGPVVELFAGETDEVEIELPVERQGQRNAPADW